MPEFDNFKENSLEKYDTFTLSIVEPLTAAGAYIPNNSSPSSPIKPSWWTEECNTAISDKKARKAYLLNPNKENLDLYLQIESSIEKM